MEGVELELGCYGVRARGTFGGACMHPCAASRRLPSILLNAAPALARPLDRIGRAYPSFALARLRFPSGARHTMDIRRFGFSTPKLIFSVQTTSWKCLGGTQVVNMLWFLGPLNRRRFVSVSRLFYLNFPPEQQKTVQ